MSNSLPLLLDRAINDRYGTNKLSLPIARKFGDLNSYIYVYANALPLRLERKINAQSSANALYLAMSQPLGTLAPVRYVTSNALPIPLSVPISDRPPSDTLPLGMTRKIGTAIGDQIPPVVSNNVTVTINAIATITPTATVNIASNNTDIAVTITAFCELKPTASITASYDANAFRGLVADVSSGMQQSRLQGISKRGYFEHNNQLNTHTNAGWQQSKLASKDSQSQFEANKHLETDSSLLFEQSRLIGDTNKQMYESQNFISNKAQLKHEQAKLVAHSVWYSFEAMLKRQIERVFSAEYSELITDRLDTSSEYGQLTALSFDIKREFARLPYSKLRYVPPPLSQTVILKEQVIEGWECGSGALRHYVYNDELPLPMHRRIEGRAASSNLALTMDRPRGILTLSADDANALPTYPCKRKTIGVNPSPDIVMCQPKVFGKSVAMSVNAQATLNVIALLNLMIEESGEQPLPSKGVIFVTNSVALTRSDDGREIKMLGFNVGIDTNSYTWSFSATVPLSELSKVDTAHEQRIGVDFECNGNLWRFILDSCDDSVSFGESSLTIKGKSRAMLLANPYAAQRGFKFGAQMSARQIAEAELNRNGVPSGFTLDWQLAGANGWNIPANTYSYSNKTPINSVQWIAEAAGGFINADMSADILHVLAHYPVPSWEWSAQTPSINLTQSLITSRSRGRVNKPGYNGVTVYGENDNGIGALIKRTGTSGGYQPPMVTSDLMTDQLAAISRGKMILSDTGDIGNIGISMPLVADVGVLKPSTLIGVNDGESWIGMVRGTTITGRLSSNRALEIEQSIDVERHFDKG